MTEPRENLVGRIFSERYRLTRKVGEGAMGQVYLARHTFMDKNVAVKVLHPELLDHEEVVERFQREAKAAGAIEHPNICAATDFGRYDKNGLFLVMEWLDGRSLDDLITSESPLEFQRCVHIAAQIASALERAHALKIIHRDLKPANIMLVTKDGDKDFVKVTDFGVARVPVSNGDKLTQAGMTYGTPSYMSPEQAMGDEIDPRTDIYAFGCMLFEMLTGHVPFEGASVAHILSMQVTEPAPHVSAHRKDVPADLDALVHKCLEKDPANRFQNAGEVKAALQSLDLGLGDTQGVPSVEQPATISTRRAAGVATEVAPEGPQKPPKILAILGILALLSIGLVVAIGISLGDAVGDTVAAARQASLAEERAEFARQPEIAKALELQAQGKTNETLEALRSAELNYQSNPHFQFLLGSALQASNDSAGSFEAFSKAVQLRNEYKDDEGLRKAVITAASDESAADAVAAYVAKFGDERLIAEILKLANGDVDRRQRETLVAVLKSSGAYTQLKRSDQLLLEVRTTRSCRDLKPLADEAIAEHADEAIRYLSKLPKRGCGFLNRSDCYSCIRKDIDAAFKARGLADSKEKSLGPSKSSAKP